MIFDTWKHVHYTFLKSEIIVYFERSTLSELITHIQESWRCWVSSRSLIALEVGVTTDVQADGIIMHGSMWKVTEVSTVKDRTSMKDMTDNVDLTHGMYSLVPNCRRGGYFPNIQSFYTKSRLFCPKSCNVFIFYINLLKNTICTLLWPPNFKENRKFSNPPR